MPRCGEKESIRQGYTSLFSDHLYITFVFFFFLILQLIFRY